MQEENSGIEERSVRDLFYQLGGTMRKDKKLTVKLSSCGNPDFRGQESSDILSPAQIGTIASLEAASIMCRAYIEGWDLGGGNWTGGQIFENGKQIAKVSYNGRIWDMDDNEISISKEEK